MKDQHEKIAGYRDLTQEELDLINEIKAEGARFGALCKKLLDLGPIPTARFLMMNPGSKSDALKQALGVPVDAQNVGGPPVTLGGKLLDDPGAVWTDARWISIAQTHFQQGLMALTRSVARPSHF